MILLSHIVGNKNQWPLSLLSKWWPRNELSNTIENMKVHITNILYWHANLPVHNAAICANKRITCLIKWYCIKHVILLSLHPSLSLSLSLFLSRFLPAVFHAFITCFTIVLVNINYNIHQLRSIAPKRPRLIQTSEAILGSC